MSQLELGSWESRPYGQKARGLVTVGKQAVRVCVRTPQPETPQTGLTYVLAPGWTGDGNNMRFAAIEAVHHGHTAVTLAHTNKGVSKTMAKNADDVAAVLDAAPKQTGLAVIGHSMGGATAILALLKTDRQIERATFVAPVKHLREEYYTRSNIRHSLWDALHEQRSLEGDELTAKAIGASTLRHCLRRPRAVVAEFFALIGGSLHDEVRRLKEPSDAPYLRIAYGDADGLFPAYAMEHSIEDLPYDERVLYKGGHCRVNYDPALARILLDLDDPLGPSTPEAETSLLAV